MTKERMRSMKHPETQCDCFFICYPINTSMAMSCM